MVGNADVVISRVLALWSPHNEFLSWAEVLLNNLYGEEHDGSRQRFYDMLQQYLLEERKTLLDAHFASLPNGAAGVSPEEVDRLNPSKDEMFELNAIVGFYGVHRVFLHLYLQAHLVNVLTGNGPHGKLMTLVHELRYGS